MEYKIHPKSIIRWLIICKNPPNISWDKSNLYQKNGQTKKVKPKQEKAIRCMGVGGKREENRVKQFHSSLFELLHLLNCSRDKLGWHRVFDLGWWKKEKNSREGVMIHENNPLLLGYVNLGWTF